MTLYFIFQVLMATILFIGPVALLSFRNEKWMPSYLRVPERWGFQAVLIMVLMLALIMAGMSIVVSLMAIEVH